MQRAFLSLEKSLVNFGYIPILICHYWILHFGPSSILWQLMNFRPMVSLHARQDAWGLLHCVTSSKAKNVFFLFKKKLVAKTFPRFFFPSQFLSLFIVILFLTGFFSCWKWRKNHSRFGRVTGWAAFGYWWHRKLCSNSDAYIIMFGVHHKVQGGSRIFWGLWSWGLLLRIGH